MDRVLHPRHRRHVNLYYLNVTLHLLAAFVWLGGLFFLVIAAPIFRRVEPPRLRAELFSQLGRQLRIVGWISIAILIITGVGNLQFRGLLRWQILGSPDFWSTPLGHALMGKLILVALILAVSAVHDFVVGPASTRAEPGSPEAVRLRSYAAWLGRLSGLIGILLVYVAVRLARGG